MIKGTIVLEGGARRGIFTSGVLDYLMEQDVIFSDVIGVSFLNPWRQYIVINIRIFRNLLQL